MKEIACDGYEKGDLKRLFGLTLRALTSLVASETLKAHLQPHQELTSYQILYTNQYVAIKPFSSCEFSLLSVLASKVSG